MAAPVSHQKDLPFVTRPDGSVAHRNSLWKRTASLSELCATRTAEPDHGEPTNPTRPRARQPPHCRMYSAVSQILRAYGPRLSSGVHYAQPRLPSNLMPLIIIDPRRSVTVKPVGIMRPFLLSPRKRHGNFGLNNRVTQ